MVEFEAAMGTLSLDRRKVLRYIFLILLAEGRRPEAFGGGAGCGARGRASQARTREAPGPRSTATTSRLRGARCTIPGANAVDGNAAPGTEKPRWSAERRARYAKRAAPQGASWCASRRSAPLAYAGRACPVCGKEHAGLARYVNKSARDRPKARTPRRRGSNQYRSNGDYGDDGANMHCHAMARRAD
jgi:hypothetical protein